MKSIKGKVEYLLKKTPHLRDDDNKLIATYWWHQFGTDKINLVTGKDFLQTFADGKLVSPESVRRVRQKLQEQKPELRGESYNRRQSDGDDMSKNIGEL